MEGSKRLLILLLLLLGALLFSTHWVFSERLPALLAASEQAALSWSWVFSDLDGDNRPDFASGWSTPDGYTVEIRYSTRLENAVLVLGPGATVVRCVQFDVDRDADQDLLISSIGMLEHRVAWVNDGQGHFSRSDRSANVYLHTSGLTSTLESKYDALDRATFNLTERPPIDRTPRNGFCPILGAEISAAVDSRGPSSKLAPDKLATRGPPLT